MKIKLLKDAIIHGIPSKADKVHEVIDNVAQKLINRGYAILDDGKPEIGQEETDNGDTTGE